MKYISRLFVVVMLITSVSLSAQQDAHFTLYNYNMNVINPAYAGSSNDTEFNFNMRSQWVNLNNSPETQSFSFATPLNDKVGIGVSIVHDKVFVLEESGVYVDLSYKVPVSANDNLFLGLKAGGSFIDIDLLSVGLTNDPLFTENVSRFNPNVGAGAYLKGQKYFLSLSVPGILKNERYEKEGVLVTDASDNLHMYLGGGYTFGLNTNIDFTPSLMARYVTAAPVSLDLTGTFNLYDKVEVAASYRLQESINGVFLVKLTDWIKFGYAYEHTLTEVGDYNEGSHEVMLRFNFDFKKKKSE